MNQTLSIVRRHWPPLLALNFLLIATTVYVITNIEKLVSPIWTANAQLNMPTNGDQLNADLGTLGNLSDGGSGFLKRLILFILNLLF